MSERIYIAVGPNCWGKGKDRREAVKNMQKHWATFMPKTAQFAVWSCPPDSRVTEFGDIAYPTTLDGVETQPPILVSRGDSKPAPLRVSYDRRQA